IHNLQYVAFRTMNKYYPELKKQLLENKAVKMDWGYSLNLYSHGGFKKKFVKGFDLMTMTRPLLEYLIREFTLSRSNIILKDNTLFKSYLLSDDKKRINGIKVINAKTEEENLLKADLVVDVMGRGSRTSRLLTELEFETPDKSKVKINMVYNTRIYTRDPEDPRGADRIMYKPTPPKEKLGVLLIPIEDNKWTLTLTGRHGGDPAMDYEGTLKFLKGLPFPDLYNIISKSNPIGEPMKYKFLESQWIHYEKLKNFPMGLLVLGDAVSSFNPIYAQGMSAMSFQVDALNGLLKNNTPDDKLAKKYFNSVKKINGRCWKTSVWEDFRYPETVGTKPFMVKVINKFLDKTLKVSNNDEVVYEAFLSVAMMVKSPITLFKPKILWRIFKTK
ncbi:MAG: hypothetical protein ACWIPJ_10055, partial [Polaribacter sp.]